MMHYNPLKFALLLSSLAGPLAFGSTDKPLNVLLITADDLNFDSVGYRGCPVEDVTPHLDALAAQSLSFHQAYVNIAVSQPSRGVMATGLYPHKSGVEGFNHVDAVPTIMSIMREAGYAVGIAGKREHSTPVKSFRWDVDYDWDKLAGGRDPQRFYEVFSDLVQLAKEQDKPFYFMANSHDPHAPFYGSHNDFTSFKGMKVPPPSRVYTAEEVPVPEFLLDRPKTREELAQYYSSVRRLDDVVAAVLRVLKEQGLEENTMVIFMSDHGMDFPFAKTNCYVQSNKTPLIVKYPGVVKENTVDKTHFVASIDLMPTILDACQIPLSHPVDGRSFLPLLKGETQTDREEVYTQFYETNGKKAYPMFAIHDAHFSYIYSPWSDGRVFRNCSWANMTFKEWTKLAESDPVVAERLNLFKYRCPQELYDLKADPACLHNLAQDPQYAATLKVYQDKVATWMRKTGAWGLDLWEHRDDTDYCKQYIDTRSQRKKK